MMSKAITTNVYINASPEVVWVWLTSPEHLQQWMGDADLQISTESDWQTGSPIVISGFHHAYFRNTGFVVRNEAPYRLTYTHLSSLSHLSDSSDNYACFDFKLSISGNGTLLLLEVSNCVTESIFRHLQFYWPTTLQILKDKIESVYL